MEELKFKLNRKYWHKILRKVLTFTKNASILQQHNPDPTSVFLQTEDYEIIEVSRHLLEIWKGE